MELNFAPFVRKPFSVEAVQVTEENLKGVAKLIGRVQREPNGSRYIQVEKGKVPNVTKVYVGYWVTRLSENNTNLRVYSGKTFTKEFSPIDIPKTAEVTGLSGNVVDTSDTTERVSMNDKDDTAYWRDEDDEEEVEVDASSERI